MTMIKRQLRINIYIFLITTTQKFTQILVTYNMCITLINHGDVNNAHQEPSLHDRYKIQEMTKYDDNHCISWQVHFAMEWQNNIDLSVNNESMRQSSSSINVIKSILNLFTYFSNFHQACELEQIGTLFFFQTHHHTLLLSSVYFLRDMVKSDQN